LVNHRKLGGNIVSLIFIDSVHKVTAHIISAVFSRQAHKLLDDTTPVNLSVFAHKIRANGKHGNLCLCPNKTPGLSKNTAKSTVYASATAAPAPASSGKPLENQ